jgi:hypothetical protein
MLWTHIWTALSHLTLIATIDWSWFISKALILLFLSWLISPILLIHIKPCYIA